METTSAAGRSEWIAVALLSVLGAAHVFIFAAALPFFGVADEQVHLDLVVRYSHGDVPRSLTPPDPQALPFLAIYGTPEYLNSPGSLPGGILPPPPWKQPIASVKDKLAAKEAAYQSVFKNHEAASPPLYYGLAGAWWRLGKAAGLDGGELLYWLRFLNVLLLALLVWLGWWTARNIFPENVFIRIAVPALIAFLPQSTFYFINNDILTPLTFGAAFVQAWRFFATDQPSPLLAVSTGLAIGAAYLTKTSNLPLLAVLALFFGLRLLFLAWHRRLTGALKPFLILLVTALVPMMAWMIWCKTNFGDFTGSKAKIQFLNWAHNPSAYWLSHPIFTGAGLWYYVKGNLATFWQGEMLWRHLPLTNPGVDQAYVVLTLGALALTLVAALRRPPQFTANQQTAVWMGLLCVAAAFTFFAILSVAYDFQDCFYPSRKLPYFVSGRLMLGMLIPFLILFACGLDVLMKRFQYITKFTLLIALLGFMLGSEISIDWPVFFNEYNWFHL